MDDNLKDAAAAAWKEVLAHPAADLKNYLSAEGVNFNGKLKPEADFCPVCKGKKKIRTHAGHGRRVGIQVFQAGLRAQ